MRAPRRGRPASERLCLRGLSLQVPDEKKKPGSKPGFFSSVADQLTRLRYSFVRVSISILSPMAQNSGTFSS